MKKLIAMILCISMLLALCGCETTDDSGRSSRRRNRNREESEEYMDSDEPSEMDEPAYVTYDTYGLARNVTMTDVSIAPIDAYGPSLYSLDPTPGYVIQATVSNKNSVSCDVFPMFSFYVEDRDNYDNPRVRKVLLNDSDGVFTPYGPKYHSLGEDAMDPVGVAPNETKVIRYYFFGSINCAVFDEDGKLTSRTSIYAPAIESITDFQLYGLKAQKAYQVYIPVDEWGDNLWVEEVDESRVGLTQFRSYAHGTITNTTEDQWNTVTFTCEYMVNNEGVYSYVSAKNSQVFYYVDIGDTIGFKNSGERITFTEKPGHNLEIFPTLLAYTPEEKS